MSMILQKEDNNPIVSGTNKYEYRMRFYKYIGGFGIEGCILYHEYRNIFKELGYRRTRFKRSWMMMCVQNDWQVLLLS